MTMQRMMMLMLVYLYVSSCIIPYCSSSSSSSSFLSFDHHRIYPSVIILFYSFCFSIFFSSLLPSSWLFFWIQLNAIHNRIRSSSSSSLLFYQTRFSFNIIASDTSPWNNGLDEIHPLKVVMIQLDRCGMRQRGPEENSIQIEGVCVCVCILVSTSAGWLEPSQQNQ